MSNIVGFLFFSSLLEIILGRSRIIIVMLLSAIGGTIGSLLFHMVDWMVGSSTILFGVFGGLGVLVVKYKRELHKLFIAAVISWCINFILLSTLGYLSLSIVDQGAHVGGFVAGTLTTWILVYSYSTTEINKTPGFRVRVLLMVLLAVFGLSVFKEVVPLLPLLA
jgi:membrane associated rhomboid family serine protease